MRHRVIFGLAGLGFLAGLAAAYFMSGKNPALPPAFKPAENPYPNGIYSEGIIESAQPSGANLNVFPEVGGVVESVAVLEGERVEPGAVLLRLDDSVPRAQAQSALAAMRSAEDALAKQEKAHALDPRSVSRDALDSARSSAAAARADYQAARALLAKYTLAAHAPAVVLALNAAAGSYVSPQGVYDTYTQGYEPVLVLGAPQADLQVRCFVDEILVDRLPAPHAIKAQLALRGSGLRIPLQFLRVQPFISPKIELSDQRLERVDVRVLPVLFRFAKPSNVNIYPGELVDVYIGQ
ncbi:MAG: biotin/lipoyl-binding protein [Elusimicrobia bacterium]|nr:biotin/lipoyl-binding protein [Elusimicrobiota bacterium]